MIFSDWSKIGWLMLAGSLGTLSRYWLSGWVQQSYGSGLPLGTLAVNVVGCFVFGFIWTLAEDERLLISGETRLLILIGFAGSFTTFSTFAFETSALLRDSQWLLASGNFLAHNLLGMAALILGIVLGRLV